MYGNQTADETLYIFPAIERRDNLYSYEVRYYLAQASARIKQENFTSVPKCVTDYKP